MSEFTKGPWVRSVNANGCVFVTHSDMRRNGGHIIASASGKDEVANANLIAAAPDMLEALELMVKHFENEDESARCMDNNVLHMALGALAKAKGENK